MPQSRRTFLRDGLCSAISVALLLAGSRAGLGQTARGQGRVSPSTRSEIPIEAQKEPTFVFKAETFKPYVNGIFQAPNARGEMIDLRLIKVVTYKSSDKVTSRDTTGFSLTFKASAELPPFTSIHTIKHSALGEFDLFLTMRETQEGDIYYEAVFNHFK